MNEAGFARAFQPPASETPESHWAEWLATAEIWAPAPGPICVVSPHPDDEILAAGGLIHSWTQAGYGVTVLSVTDGEAADRRWLGLGAVRRHALNSALRRLAARHVALVRLGIADGEVQKHQQRLRNFLSSVIERDTTLIAPYEEDGHPDHDAAGAVCLEVARAQALRLVRYPVWRWHHGDPRALRAARWGKFPLDAEAQRAKAQALLRFGSQSEATEGRSGSSRLSEAAQADAPSSSFYQRPYEAFILETSSGPGAGRPTAGD